MKHDREDKGEEEQEEEEEEGEDNDDEDRADEGSTGSQSSEEDEEDSIGLNGAGEPADQTQKPNTAKIYPTLPQTPAAQQLSPPEGSPNAVLASFFSKKGDTPLSEIEIEGVKALLAKQNSNISPKPYQTQPPSYATPARRAYQPIFTPATLSKTSIPATEARRPLRRTGYTPSTISSSPFRRPIARTSFTPARYQRPSAAPSPSKYELRSSVPPSEAAADNSKRPLEEVAVPAAKRFRHQQEESSNSQSTVETGSKTAASMLEILDSDGPPSGDDNPPAKSPEQLKTMLNPYASSSSPRKPAGRPIRSPVRKERRLAVDEIARNDAIEKKIPYQPKKSSGLANSFTADDEVSLFSPKRRIHSPAASSESQKDAKKHSGFTFNTQKADKQVETPTKSQNSLSSAFGSRSTAIDMFSSNNLRATHSITPKFSFDASQINGKSSESSFGSSTAGGFQQTMDSTPTFNFGSHKKSEKDHSDVDGSASATNSQQPIPPRDIETRTSTQAPEKDAPESSVATESGKLESNVPALHSMDDQEEHRAHGGFVVSDEASNSGASLSTSALALTSKPVNTNQDSAPTSSDLVHTLRDGTSYISPSKTRNKSETTSEQSVAATASGFVFAPSNTATSSVFNFSSYSAPTSSVPATGGFTFNPEKKASDETPTEESKVSKPTKSLEKVLEPKARALEVPETKLKSFAFSVVAKADQTDLQKKVLSAEIISFKFSTSEGSTSTNITSSKNGFDWSAAGFKQPEVGWTCATCMIGNKADAAQCVACESDRPSSKEPGRTLDATKPNTGGGFDWAAAGMKKPEAQWACSVCMVSNPDDKDVCLSCESERG